MNLSDLARNSYMLRGRLARRGYMRWWHSFTGVHTVTGETRTFFVEFYVVNPALGQSLPILGQHPYFKKRGMKPSYVMVKAGAFPDEKGNGGRQLHAFYPVSSLQATGTPLVMRLTKDESSDESSAEPPTQSPGTFSNGLSEELSENIRQKECFYSEDRLYGSVEVTPQEARHRSLMTNPGYMEWDLKVSKAVSCHTGLLGSRLAEALHMLDSYWHGEGIRSFFRGSVILDGEMYEVTPELSYGYADKHWGHRFNNPWFQFACGKLASERTGKELRHSVLATSSICPRFLCFSLRQKFLLQLTYMGEDFEFTHCKWEVKESEKRFIWHMLARSKNAVLKLSGSCKKETMMHLRYENPDGILSPHPLWADANGVGSLQLYRKGSGGRELLDTLKMENALCLYRAE